MFYKVVKGFAFKGLDLDPARYKIDKCKFIPFKFCFVKGLL